MFNELINRLYAFASDNKLLIEISTTDDELTYTLQDKSRSWGYQRYISNVEYEAFGGSRLQRIDYEINRLRRKLVDVGVI